MKCAHLIRVIEMTSSTKAFHLTVCRVVGALLVATMLPGCRRPRPVIPDAGFHREFTVASGRDATFEALLRVAHQLNLTVRVIEKQSGLVGFTNAGLNASQLDQFARYPFTKGKTDQPYDTFTGWQEKSLEGGGGPVTGTVTVDIVLTAISPVSTDVDFRSNWVAGNFSARYSLSSKDVLEKEVERVLRERLGTSPGQNQVDPFDD